MFFQTLLQSKSVNAPIQFNGSDETNCFPVKGSEVDIVTSEGDHEVGSSKLKIKNIVNFGWEHKYYPGQLVAAHMSGNYIAYAITTPGKGCGVVRVVNRITDERCLIKGMKGAVVDLSFAHTKDEVIIGAVDSLGNLFVHRVLESPSGLNADKFVIIMRDSTSDAEEMHRLIWCPYLPEPLVDDDEEEPDSSASKLLVLSHGPQAEIWSLDMVVEHHGQGPLSPADIEQGLLIITDIGGDVVDAAFSPDGSALATASGDGQVKFFQVYLHEEGPPRCLHQWSPHDGKALSCLFFLDDHSNFTPDVQYWKFAVTGCSFNTELKVWSCETWTCLQTIKFKRPDEESLRLKADLDPTAKYLILADIDKCLVFVLNVDQTGESGASIISVAEFATQSAFLSLSCVSAGIRMVKQTAEGVEVSVDEDQIEESDKRNKTVVRLYFIQPKSLQECYIIYEDGKVRSSMPKNSDCDKGEVSDFVKPMLGDLSSTGLESPTGKTPPPLGQSSPRYADPLSSGISLPMPIIGAHLASNVNQLAEAASKISLLSPDQFQISLPPKQELDGIAPATPSLLASQTDSSPSTTPHKLEIVQTVSGNSSPSREVANILEEVEHFQDDVDDEEEDESPTVDGICQEIDSTPSPTVKLSHSVQFPNPPSVPQQVNISTEIDTMNISMERKIKQERESGVAIASGLDPRFETVMMRRMEQLEKKMDELSRQGRMDYADYIVNSIKQDVLPRVEHLVSQEMNRVLPGLVSRSMEETERNVLKRLGNLESKVSKELASSQSRESIGRAVAASVSDLVDSSYRKAFAHQAAGFEKAMGSMLKQISEQFLAGSREYEAALGRRMEVENVEVKNIVAPLFQNMSSEIHGLKTSVERITNDQTAISTHISEMKGSVSGQEVREIVRKELSSALQGRHFSATPQPDIKNANIQHDIQRLIQAGKLNDAFQTALSSNDLSLVVFTCELLNTTQVFNSVECPLSQSVLLSLIHQLSFDLNEKTEVKHAYLHEALVNLNPADATTKVHMKTVLGQLEQSLKKYIQANPNSKMTRNMKLLQMAAAASHMQN